MIDARENIHYNQFFEAILYLLVSGCQWRRLPHDYPAWKSVYYYYHKWRQRGSCRAFP